MQRRIAAIMTLIAAAAASAGAWDYPAVISPDVSFYARDLPPFDGVPDDLQGNCVRRSSTVRSVGCYEYPIERLEEIGGIFVDLDVNSRQHTPLNDPVWVTVEIYPADGIASLDDATTPGEEVGMLATALWLTGKLYVDVAPAIAAYHAAGYTHLGVRLTTNVESESCAGVWPELRVTWDCPWCVYDYNRDGQWETIEDIAAFIADWTRGNPCADVDRSGNVDFADYEDWLDQFGAQHCLW